MKEQAYFLCSCSVLVLGAEKFFRSRSVLVLDRKKKFCSCSVLVRENQKKFCSRSVLVLVLNLFSDVRENKYQKITIFDLKSPHIICEHVTVGNLRNMRHIPQIANSDMFASSK